jgi:hypothetical protein
VSLVCWKCGASLAELPRPLERLAECPQCRAYQHVCRLCQFYDPRLSGKCREDRAEEVLDKERPNFCDWFKAKPQAYRAPGAANPVAKSDLGALFGGDAAGTDSKTDAARDRLDDLFGDKSKHDNDK